MKKGRILLCIWLCLLSTMFSASLLTAQTPVDLTNYNGTISAQYTDSPTGEEIDKLIDNSSSTKYLTFHASGWVQFQADSTYVVTSYTITSANDYAERDPLTWTFQGSNNGSTWTTLDSRTGEDFPNRFQLRSYSFTNATGYSYYRLNMTNNSGTILQLAEWEIFGTSGTVNTATPTPTLTPTPASGLTDITNISGTVTAQYYDSPSGEEIDKLTDNSSSTKYLTFHAAGWVQFQANASYVVTQYTITSANDAAERDPLTWTFLGSANGSTWTTLDSRSGEDFPNRFQLRTFSFNNSASYNYYRLNMTNNSGTILQLAEWEIFGTTGTVNTATPTATTANTATPTRTPTPIANTATPTPTLVGLTDITNSGGTVTAQYYDSPTGEEIDKLIDNSSSTKYLTFHASGWVQFQANASYVVTQYTITSANDAAERDPYTWTLQGSNNGSTWTTLDSRSGEDFPNRFQLRTFSFNNSASYNYYRLNMTNNSGTILQLAEWEIFGTPGTANTATPTPTATTVNTATPTRTPTPTPTATPTAANSYDIYSPDSQIRINFTLDNGVPRYSVSYGSTAIVNPSRLGFVFNNEPAMTGDFRITAATTRSTDETWVPVWGQDSSIRNNYNELAVNLQENSGEQRLLILRFKAYNDGIGFRYELPSQPNLGYFEITSEETYFEFTGNHQAYYIEDNYDSYEWLYNELYLGNAATDGCNTPLTMRMGNGVHLSVHEADLTDWAGMTLKRPAGGGTYSLKSELVPWYNSNIKVKANTPHVSPWRTIQISPNAGGLAESHLIQNLNDPCAIADTSWIKPRKFLGIWWGMISGVWGWDLAGGRHGATTARAMRYIDACVNLGIEALLIEGWDEGWEDTWRDMNFTQPYPDFDLPAVARYAADRGIKIVGHHETGGGIANYMNQIHDAFALYNSLGIDTVKTGYVSDGKEAVYSDTPAGREHHHGQYMVNHYQEVVEIASQYHIMIDAHEPIKPTGISRTWPNFMAREGGRGGEYNAFGGNPPQHSTLLPFTRFLGGPMDFTPGIFDCAYASHRFSTRAHQLAISVIFYSPIQMAADLFQAYTGEPEFRFIRNLPVGNFDETRYLDAVIGDYIVMARRKGNNWYLGAVTDNNARTRNVNLSFLNPGTTYTAYIYADAADADYNTNPNAVAISTQSVTSSTTISLNLRPGGGAAIEFYPSGSAPAAPSGSAGTIVSGATYRLLAKHSDKALEVSNFGTADGDNIQQWDYVGGSSQHWVITDVGGGYYTLTNVNSGKVLDVQDANVDNGANIHQWAYVGAAQQQWQLVHQSGTFFRLINRNSGKYLEVSGGVVPEAYVDGANVQQWEFDYVPTQVWSIELVN